MKLTSGRCTLILFLLANLVWTPVWAQEAQLRIVIVEGEGAINNVKQRVNREPIVQVEDENRKPIAGAAVVFFLPDQGPSGTFANGSRTLTVTTDANGRAGAMGIRPNNVNGQMQIRVTASFQGQVASAVINQVNAGGGGGGGGSSAGGGLSAGAKWAIILAIGAGAAAGGAYAATSGGKSSSSTGGAVVISPGTPTVGGPH